MRVKARVALCARRNRTLRCDLDGVVCARAADVAVRRLVLETVSGSDNAVSTLTVGVIEEQESVPCTEHVSFFCL